MARPPFLAVKSRHTPPPTINVVPLVDVLLVLLVILLVTAPTLLHAVRTELPRATSSPQTAVRDAVTLTLLPDGQLLWNSDPIDRTELLRRLEPLAAAGSDAPPVLLAVHRAVPFESAAQLMVTLTQAGITHARFLLEPAPY